MSKVWVDAPPPCNFAARLPKDPAEWSFDLCQESLRNAGFAFEALTQEAVIERAYIAVLLSSAQADVDPQHSLLWAMTDRDVAPCTLVFNYIKECAPQLLDLRDGIIPNIRTLVERVRPRFFELSIAERAIQTRAFERVFRLPSDRHPFFAEHVEEYTMDRLRALLYQNFPNEDRIALYSQHLSKARSILKGVALAFAVRLRTLAVLDNFQQRLQIARAKAPKPRTVDVRALLDQLRRDLGSFLVEPGPQSPPSDPRLRKLLAHILIRSRLDFIRTNADINALFDAAAARAGSIQESAFARLLGPQLDELSRECQLISEEWTKDEHALALEAARLSELSLLQVYVDDSGSIFVGQQFKAIELDGREERVVVSETVPLMSLPCQLEAYGVNHKILFDQCPDGNDIQLVPSLTKGRPFKEIVDQLSTTTQVVVYLDDSSSTIHFSNQGASMNTGRKWARTVIQCVGAEAHASSSDGRVCPYQRLCIVAQETTGEVGDDRARPIIAALAKHSCLHPLREPLQLLASAIDLEAQVNDGATDFVHLEDAQHTLLNQVQHLSVPVLELFPSTKGLVHELWTTDFPNDVHNRVARELLGLNERVCAKSIVLSEDQIQLENLVSRLARPKRFACIKKTVDANTIGAFITEMERARLQTNLQFVIVTFLGDFETGSFMKLLSEFLPASESNLRLLVSHSSQTRHFFQRLDILQHVIVLKGERRVEPGFQLYPDRSKLPAARSTEDVTIPFSAINAVRATLREYRSLRVRSAAGFGEAQAVFISCSEPQYFKSVFRAVDVKYRIDAKDSQAFHRLQQLSVQRILEKGSVRRTILILDAEVLSACDKTTICRLKYLVPTQLVFCAASVTNEDRILFSEQNHSFVQATPDLDFLHEYYEKQDPKIVHYRVCKMLFGSLWSLELTGSYKSDDTSGCCQTVAVASGGLLSDLEVKKCLQVVDSFQTRLPTVLPADNPLELAVFLALSRVRATPTSMEELSFEDYCSHAPLAQLNSQSSNLNAWFRYQASLLSFKHPHPIVFQNNLHCNVLLTSLKRLEALDDAQAPGYFLLKAAHFHGTGRALVSQASQGLELDWNSLAASSAFPASLASLLELLDLVSHPVRLLACIHAERLFELLELIPADQSQITRLTRVYLQLSETDFIRAASGSSFATTLAVMRWAFNSLRLIDRLGLEQDASTRLAEPLALTREDVQALVKLDLTISSLGSPTNAALFCRYLAELNSDPAEVMSFISRQPSVASFLAEPSKLGRVLADSHDRPLGSVLISFLVSSCGSGAQSAIAELDYVRPLHDLLRWDGHNPAHFTLRSLGSTRDQLPSLFLRATPEAVGVIVRNLKNSYQAQPLAELLDLRTANWGGTERASWLVSALAAISPQAIFGQPFANELLQRHALKQAISTLSEDAKRDVEQKPFLDQGIRSAVAILLRDAVRLDGVQPLPTENFEFLSRILCRQFADSLCELNEWNTLKLYAKLHGQLSEAGFNALIQFILAQAERRERLDNVVLLLFAWCHSPRLEIHRLNLLPPDFWYLFQTVVGTHRSLLCASVERLQHEDLFISPLAAAIAQRHRTGQPAHSFGNAELALHVSATAFDGLPDHSRGYTRSRTTRTNSEMLGYDCIFQSDPISHSTPHPDTSVAVAQDVPSDMHLIDATLITCVQGSVGSLQLSLQAGGICEVARLSTGFPTRQIFVVRRQSNAQDDSTTVDARSRRVFTTYAECWAFCLRALHASRCTLFCHGLFLTEDSARAEHISVSLDTSYASANVLPPIWSLQNYLPLYGIVDQAWELNSLLCRFHELFEAVFPNIVNRWAFLPTGDLRAVSQLENQLLEALKTCLASRKAGNISTFLDQVACASPLRASILEALHNTLTNRSAELSLIANRQPVNHPLFREDIRLLSRDRCVDLKLHEQTPDGPNLGLPKDSLKVLHTWSNPFLCAWVDPDRFFLRKDNTVNVPLLHIFLEPTFATTPSLGELGLADWYQLFLLAPLGAEAKQLVANMLRNPKGVALSQTSLSLEDRIVLYSLGQSLRTVHGPELVARLEALAAITPAQRLVLDRPGFLYGVHVIDFLCDAKQVLDTLSIVPCDFSQLSAAARQKDSEVFNRIRSHIRDQATLLVITGLETVSNLVMKWCCELTAVRPWLYIYFVSIPVHEFFAETKERLRIHAANDAVNSRFSAELKDLKLPEDLNQAWEEREQFTAIPQTHFNEAWMETFTTATIDEFQASRNSGAGFGFVRFLCGPPGVGKTHLMTKLRDAAREKDIRFEVLNASSGELARCTIGDVVRNHDIERKAGHLKGLIWNIDEWHFLQDEQKAQLLEYCCQFKCLLIVIANRFDESDIALIEKAVRARFSREKHLVNARGSHKFVMENFLKRTPNTASAVRFVTLWHRVMRLLLGEEILSFRFAHGLADLYQKYIHQELLRELADMLQAKFTFLDERFCFLLQDAFLELLRQDSLRLAELRNRITFHDLLGTNGCHRDLDDHIAFVQSEQANLVDLLVFAAASDVEMVAMTYAEFCTSSDTMRNAAEVHPAFKLYRYVAYLFALRDKSRKAEDLTLRFRPRREFYRQIFGKYLITEVPGQFPCIHLGLDPLPLQRRLRQSYSLCTLTSPDNLPAMTRDILRGFVPPRRATIRAWKVRPPTDPQQFDTLASAWPDVVTWLTPSNLCALLKHASAGLATTVLNQRAESNQRDASKGAEDSRLLAAWRLYQLLRPAQPPGFRASCCVRLGDTPEICLTETFSWAAQYGAAMPLVTEPGKLEEALCQDLIQLTHELIGRESGLPLEACRELWIGYFSPLLGKCIAELPDGIWFALAPVNSDAHWPQPVRDFSAIYQGVTAISIANGLTTSFPGDLRKILRRGDKHSVTFVHNLMSCCKDQLSKAWKDILRDCGLFNERAFAYVPSSDLELSIIPR
eukprot:m.815498 g.815498  ORF g.815498 m.815498 type:complete len:2911 (-) comp59373_c0_seq1:115-8847(-)